MGIIPDIFLKSVWRLLLVSEHDVYPDIILLGHLPPHTGKADV
jgi:hypothetical protein